jgi:hypothetical protein
MNSTTPRSLHLGSLASENPNPAPQNLPSVLVLKPIWIGFCELWLGLIQFLKLLVVIVIFKANAEFHMQLLTKKINQDLFKIKVIFMFK